MSETIPFRIAVPDEVLDDLRARLGRSRFTTASDVVPSLPGFLFSELPDGPFTRRRVAEIWHALMAGPLGATRGSARSAATPAAA
jgi:hypothetical protein